MSDRPAQPPRSEVGFVPEGMPDITGGHGMPPGMAMWFDDRLFSRAKQIATYLAKAKGFVPSHLIGQHEACFAVVERSLTWKLSPYAVAQCCYQTPDGKVGYEGKLCQAILENSGKLNGPVRYEHYVSVTVKMPSGLERTFRSNDPDLGEVLDNGAQEIGRRDWAQVQGKFEIATSQKGRSYPKANWKRQDAEGLGVTVKADVHGEPIPREWHFDLIQAFPLNSTLWATDPKSQICYTAVRRFGNLAAPGLFMGVPFDSDYDPANHARDVTPPRPERNDYEEVGGPDIAARRRAMRAEAIERHDREQDDARARAQGLPVYGPEDEVGSETKVSDADADDWSQTNATAETHSQDSGPEPAAKSQDQGDLLGAETNPAATAKAQQIIKFVGKATGRKAVTACLKAEESHIVAMPENLQAQIRAAAEARIAALEAAKTEQP